MKAFLILWLSCSIWSLPFCCAQNIQTYYVIPNVSTTECPGDHCYNLSTYVRNSTYYFRSFSVFVFLSGVHFLDSDAIFHDVINVTLSGSFDSPFQYRDISSNVLLYGFDPYNTDSSITYYESSAQIRCVAPLGLAFINVKNLNISNLSIFNCGSTLNSTVNFNTSVFLWNVTNCVMDGISVQNATGFGLRAIDTNGEVQIIKSSFIGKNQFIKDQLQNVSRSHCGGQVTVYTSSNDCSTFAGGNAYFLYTGLFNQTAKRLLLSYDVFALGVDGTISTGGYLNTSCFSPTYAATGLTIRTLPFDKVMVTINHTISYRNQGAFGANLLIQLNGIPGEVALTSTNLSSTYGVGWYGGGSIVFDNMSSPCSAPNAVISNSTFGCNYCAYVDPQTVQLNGECIIVTNSIFNYSDTNSTASALLDCQFTGAKYRSDRGSCESSVFTNVDISGTNTSCTQCLFSSCIINGAQYECSQCKFTGSSYYRGVNNSCVQCRFETSTMYGLSNCTCHSCNFINATMLYINGRNTITDSVFLNSNISVAADRDLASSIQSTLFDCKFLDSPSIIVLLDMIQYHNCTFINSPISAEESQIFFSGKITMANCSSARRNAQGGAMFLQSSTIVFQDGTNVIFTNNTAGYGGAIYMDSSSLLNFPSPQTTKVSFLYNQAVLLGGAIFADDAIRGSCPFKTTGSYTDKFSIAYFEGNTACEAGSVLFGRDSICFLKIPLYVERYFTLGPLQKNVTVSSFASSPVTVLCCDSNSTKQNTMNMTLYPGEAIKLSLVSVDINSNVVPGFVFIYDNSTDVKLISALRTSLSCDVYIIRLPDQYYANETESEVLNTLTLSTQYSFLTQQVFTLYLVSVKCPVGFMEVSNGSSPTCVCELVLSRHGVSCNISDQTFSKNGNMWIGIVTNDNTLGVSDQCPYDYCNNMTTINVLDLNSQCAYDRTNVLCGQCKDGLSVKFGTSQCAQCSDLYLLLVIPFAVMGLALIGILFLFDMTVSSGTLNGLIFYANIIRINGSIYFPVYTCTSQFCNVYMQFMSIFIAWLNLDFGIETCFYNGMDSYAKTWLQFVFPSYVFAQIVAIILVGRYSSKISNLRCFNIAVPVLATQIMLCFSKLLRTTIIIFSFSSIDAGSTTTVPLVWSYDGNMEYFDVNHTLLFNCGIFVAVFILLYTALLLLVPWLQSRSNWRWVNTMKPLLDCHAGPYKGRYRYWSGVLLAVRFPLYVFFSAPFSINVRLLGIVIATVLYLLLLLSLSVYKSVFHLIIENFFHLNLLTITLALLFDPSPTPNLPVYTIVQLGIGCAFIGFVAIVVSHIVRAFKRRGCCKTRDETESKPLILQTRQTLSYTDTDFREPLMDD